MPRKPMRVTGFRFICCSTESKVGDETAGVELQRNQVYLRASNPGGLGYAHNSMQHFVAQVGLKRDR